MIINCNGLKSPEHSTNFQALLELHDPDFVLGTESKLHPGIPTYPIFPPAYTVFRKDRNGYGGGVFQAIKFDLVPNHPNIVIQGDFNLGDLNWDLEIPTITNPATTSQHNKFLNLMDDYSLTQHVKVTTTPDSEKTLDLLLTTYPNSISGVCTSDGLSDPVVV